MIRTKTGIKGFDNLIEGGFPKGSAILLGGTPGTGKTIFALQYLHNGMEKFNEPGLYVTFEEKAEKLREQALQFGWDFAKLESSSNVKIWYIPTTTLTKNTIEEIITFVKDNKIKRLVIDSLSTLSINIPTTHTNVGEVTDYSIKQFIYFFLDKLRELQDTTTILISQTPRTDSLSGDSISEFVCDGVINVVFESMGGEFSRNLLVRKIRQTKHDEDIHPLEISRHGLIVHTLK